MEGHSNIASKQQQQQQQQQQQNREDSSLFPGLDQFLSTWGWKEDELEKLDFFSSSSLQDQTPGSQPQKLQRPRRSPAEVIDLTDSSEEPVFIPHSSTATASTATSGDPGSLAYRRLSQEVVVIGSKSEHGQKSEHEPEKSPQAPKRTKKDLPRWYVAAKNPALTKAMHPGLQKTRNGREFLKRTDEFWRGQELSTRGARMTAKEKRRPAVSARSAIGRVPADEPSSSEKASQRLPKRKADRQSSKAAKKASAAKAYMSRAAASIPQETIRHAPVMDEQEMDAVEDELMALWNAEKADN